MADNEHSGGRGVNAWVQTLAILFTAIWTAWVFFFQNIVMPASAPINLSTQVQMHQAGVRPSVDQSGHRLIAIELDVTATNPSTRTVYVLNNYWVATGIRIGARPEQLNWVDQVNQDIHNRALTPEGEHYAFAAATAVASGNVVPDTELKPGESVSRSYLFYVPEGAYDMVDVQSVVPSVSKPNAAAIEWTLAPDGGVHAQVFRVDAAGHRSEMHANADGQYTDRSLNLQQAESRRELSLWDPPSASAH